jgi:DNA-binding CsgD family transcriptional regulator
MLTSYNTTQSVAYLANLHFASCREHVAWLFRELVDRYQISGMAVQRLQTTADGFDQPLCMNFGRFVRLQPEYLEQELYRQDALILQALGSEQDFAWDLRLDTLRDTPLGAQMAQQGIFSGISAARAGTHPSGQCLAAHVAFSEWLPSSEVRQIVGLMMPYLLRLASREWIGLNPVISRRQLDILQRLHAGLSPRQAASRLRIPPRTVSFHLKRLCQDLGVPDWRDALESLDQQALFN